MSWAPKLDQSNIDEVITNLKFAHQEGDEDEKGLIALKKKTMGEKTSTEGKYGVYPQFPKGSQRTLFAKSGLSISTRAWAS
jgi:hypothetical protein